MKRVVIIYANDDASPTVIADSNEPELDYVTINARGLAEGKGKINAIEFYFDAKLIGTILF